MGHWRSNKKIESDLTEKELRIIILYTLQSIIKLIEYTQRQP